MKPQSMLSLKLKGLCPSNSHPYLKTWRVYDSEEYYFLRPKRDSSMTPQIKTKDNTKGIIKTKPITKPKTKTEDNIYTRSKYECKEWHADFRNKIALTTHSYSHNRKYLEKNRIL